jgi:predicted transcriptional regulator
MAKSTRLKLAPQLTFPADAITRTFGILAVRGAGKSNTATVMAEEMYKAGLPFVVIDPEGSWWGLRSATDGRSPGLSIPILGGRHGDIPLERQGGALVADLIADTRLSCVLDLDGFESEAARKQFLLDFAQRLYRKNTDPLHLFLEEADDYIPQKPMKDETRLLRAWENIVRRGRKRGLGMTMISQRSAVINKNVLTQVETLIVMRTTGPQDRKAIQAWVDYHGQSREILDSLPELEDGEAWIWSPQWLKKTVRVQIRMRETFDSGATPSHRKSNRPAAALADVDLAEFQTRMAETIERAKAEDPKELKRMIGKLQAQLTRAKKAKPEVEVRTQVIERPVLQDEDTKALKTVAEQLQIIANNIVQALDGFDSQKAQTVVPMSPKTPVRDLTQRKPKAAAELQQDMDNLGRGEHKILTAVAQHPEGCTRTQITVLTGYKRSSRDTYLQRLLSAGLIEKQRGRLACTRLGIEVLGSRYEPLPTGYDLQTYWLGRLPRGESIILQELINAYPEAIHREILSETTGYKRSSRDTYLQRLVARELIDRMEGSMVKANDLLFSVPER